MRIAFSLLFFIREQKNHFSNDFNMTLNCIKSLSGNNDVLIVVYNQGKLENTQVETLLKNYDINFEIIGDGINIGIPKARELTFEYIWNNYSEINYIGELHADMILYKEWYLPLINYLDKNRGEPQISCAIIDCIGTYSMDRDNKITIPNNLQDVQKLLQSLKITKIVNGFVHPVIHRVDALKEIGGIDLRFFRGKQGFEDYSILIGYAHYIGLKNRWKPKINGESTVIHFNAVQRWDIGNENPHYEIAFNQEGLYHQYGAYGFKILSELLEDNEYTSDIYKERVATFERSSLSIV